MARPPRTLTDEEIRRLVLGTFGQGRWTQDSPIVPDVWIQFLRRAEEFARARIRQADPPDQTVDLLITPWTGALPGQVARHIRNNLSVERRSQARIATSSTRVVAHLDAAALLSVVVPITGWWQGLPKNIRTTRIPKVMELVRKGGPPLEFVRYAALAGFIWEMQHAENANQISKLNALALRIGRNPEDGHIPLDDEKLEEDLAFLFRNLEFEDDPVIEDPFLTKVWLVNVNRAANQTMFDARKTVKADAARRVFDTDGRNIVFAIIDNGIDATHSGFRDVDEPRVQEKLRSETDFAADDLSWSSRVKATYDFSSLRQLLADAATDPANLTITLSQRKLSRRASRDLSRTVSYLGDRADEGGGLDWAVVSPLIQIPHDGGYVGPAADHGTHVAGILGADFTHPSDLDQPLIGICPRITLYDLRVFNEQGIGDEFSILSAIEFIGWLNRDRDNPVIHGVNLSLALRHDVDSFGCGRTPICDACNQLVGAGVVVVAAAGNMGFDGATKQSLGNGYRTVSITDPGNAEDVITVGSTHRRDPHAYGVSYFSSRGPTGDGRRKPDLLAPGEKITSTIRGDRSQRLDGTSMAAPHVAGAAALLMARYPELIGQPRKIKKILMDTATDLGRETAFQGAGLLDILRALQAV